MTKEKNITTVLKEIEKAFDTADNVKEYEEKCKEIFTKSNLNYVIFSKLKESVC